MSMGEKQQAVYRKPNGDPDGNDYILAEGETSCWIEVDGISVYIMRTNDGVSVDLCPTGKEADVELASCWATFAEAEIEEE
jgi:hypothetical protein